MPELSKNLTEVRAVAEKTFTDFPLSDSVTIMAVWGLVTVYRDGRIVDGAVED